MSQFEGLTLAQLRRKRDQSWELAGLARQDRDAADAARHTADAQRYAEAIGERIRNGEEE